MDKYKDHQDSKDDDQHSNHGGHEKHEGHGGHHDHHSMMIEDFKRRFFFSLILTVPILILSPMIQNFIGVDWSFPFDSYLLFGLSTILFIYGGKPFFTGARDELKEKSPAMMTLIAFAIAVAYIYSSLTVFILTGGDFFWELATLIVVMLLGHWIEMRSVMGASRALDALIDLMPEEAHLIAENGQTKEVAVNQLKEGDQVLVKPGEKIPIDGEIYEGISEVNEAMITGESLPVAKKTGDGIVGGSINGEGILKFVVNRTGDDTFISQIIKMVNKAQASKSKTQRLADTAAKYLFYIAFFGGILTFIVWALLGQDLNFSIERAVTVIIISCPHALGLAIPLVTAISTSIGAKSGLLIRNRAAFEGAHKLTAVVFDKTGTLTKGEFGVTDIYPIGISEEELLAIAYAVEVNSEHLIAKGIVKEAEARQIKRRTISDYQSMPGKGLKAMLETKEIIIGSPGYLRSEDISFDEENYEKLAKEGKTVVFVLQDKDLIGYLALSDQVRDTAKEAVKALKEMGIEPMMLTGDNKRVAAYVGQELGLDEVMAEVLPQEKSKRIEELIKSGKKVGMTGDGVNDAPALARADLGIAIGAGTDVAIESADVVLVKNNPLDVVNLIKLSQATHKKMIQNLIWATAYNAIALPLAAGVLYYQGIIISPAFGAVLMSMSTIIVAINAKLLKID